MTEMHRDSGPLRAVAANRLLDEAAHLQEIEGNPLTPDELAMFEMFEREGWPPEDRRAYIVRQIRNRQRTATVE